MQCNAAYHATVSTLSKIGYLDQSTFIYLTTPSTQKICGFLRNKMNVPPLIVHDKFSLDDAEQNRVRFITLRL